MQSIQGNATGRDLVELNRLVRRAQSTARRPLRYPAEALDIENCEVVVVSDASRAAEDEVVGGTREGFS